MASRFQAVTLVASPSYPNSVAWSDENLLAVASGHIVTILNPSKLYGPRGLIVLPPSKPFRIGVIKREDLLSGCLLPTCLSRDCRPCVRSISWSPLGLAPNSGCLLAVCTTEGRVKLYRMPFCEFSAEWVELMDLSDMLLDYLVNINFLELNSSSQSCGEQTTDVHMGSGCEDDLPIAVLKKKHKQTRANKWSAVNKDLGTPELQFLHHCNSKNATTGSTRQTENHFTAFLEDKIFPCSILQESPLVEVLRLDGSRRVWVPGILECCTGVKAHAMFREIDGKHDEIVEIDLEDDEICGDFCKNSGATGSNKFPKVRPSIHLGNLPENLASSIGVEKYLSIGQAVEVWTNNRWVEGLFMGFDKARLLVKFCGDHDSVILSPNSVRLAPVWISDRESWRVTVVKIEMKGQELPEVAVTNSKAKGINPSQIVPMPESEVERLKEIPENCSFPQITADEYASRTALLSSLVVAWLPTLLLSSKSVPVPLSNSSKCCSLLAIGGKSGKISFWRINGPHHYSIENGGIKNAAMLVGLLHAHDAWITTIDWASLASDASNSRVLLATGSSDGSVKLWIGSCEGLLKSSEVNYAPFLLLYEVSLVGSISVSVLSVVCPPQDQHKNILAIGRVSGSFEVWICDLSTSKFDKVGSYDVHDRVVTGLAWAFDGNCLYSCGQDYSVRGWILHKRSLFEATIPSNNLDAKCSVDIPNASDSCFGVDVSSGNMVLAVARSLDAELLDPMYQARTMKAVIDFFWIGGQQSDNLLHKKIGIEAFPGFSEEELVYWEYNILRSLNQHAHGEKPLVVWDITAALLALKQGAPKFVELILVKWISRSFGGSHLRLSIEEMLTHTSKLTSKITSRQLQLLNIICRRVVLLEFKGEDSNRLQKDLETCAEEEKINVWMKLLLSCENELRGRLVGFSMSAALHQLSCSAPKICRLRDWHSVGLAQMEQWVALDNDHVENKLRSLGSEARELAKRPQSARGYVGKEKCSFCSASVPFESPEVAFCQGVNGRSHKLLRCAVSMRVCPTTPVWFCTCCQRRASEIAPAPLFTMQECPSDFKSYVEHSTLQALSKPLCPFCGILLQRMQPDFLLSISPV